MQAVGVFVDEAESVTIEVLQYLMVKVFPKIYKCHNFQEEFPSIFELACLKTQPYDFFISMLLTLPMTVKD